VGQGASPHSSSKKWPSASSSMLPVSCTRIDTAHRDQALAHRIHNIMHGYHGSSKKWPSASKSMLPVSCTSIMKIMTPRTGITT
jgi:hypothetical protein